MAAGASTRAGYGESTLALGVVGVSVAGLVVPPAALAATVVFSVWTRLGRT